MNFYALVGTIDLARHRKSNPPMPAWLRADYDSALAKAAELALADLRTTTDTDCTRAMLGMVALAKGDVQAGALLSCVDASELDEWLEEQLNWSEVYEA